MLRVDYSRWGQTLEDLRNLSVNADHDRTRELFLALYEIARGAIPLKLAKRTSRHYQTLMRWVRSYTASSLGYVVLFHVLHSPVSENPVPSQARFRVGWIPAFAGTTSETTPPMLDAV